MTPIPGCPRPLLATLARGKGGGRLKVVISDALCHQGIEGPVYHHSMSVLVALQAASDDDRKDKRKATQKIKATDPQQNLSEPKKFSLRLRIKKNTAYER